MRPIGATISAHLGSLTVDFFIITSVDTHQRSSRKVIEMGTATSNKTIRMGENSMRRSDGQIPKARKKRTDLHELERDAYKNEIPSLTQELHNAQQEAHLIAIFQRYADTPTRRYKPEESVLKKGEPENSGVASWRTCRKKSQSISQV